MRSTLRPLLADCSAAARRDAADSCAIVGAGRTPQSKYPRTPNNNSLPFDFRTKPPQNQPYLSLPETLVKTAEQPMAGSLAPFRPTFISVCRRHLGRRRQAHWSDLRRTVVAAASEAGGRLCSTRAEP